MSVNEQRLFFSQSQPFKIWGQRMLFARATELNIYYVTAVKNHEKNSQFDKINPKSGYYNFESIETKHG